MDEDIPPTDEEAQSPPLNKEQPESSPAQESDSDSSCPNALKKHDNILPLIERQLVNYLQKVSKVLYGRITEDQWAQHEEVAVFYADLKASIEGYYEENVDHREETDNLTLKVVHEAVKDDPALNRKAIEATKAYTKNSTIVSLQATTISQDQHLAAWAKSSTSMAWNLGPRLTTIESSQAEIISEISSFKSDTSEIKSTMTEIYQAFKCQSLTLSSSVPQTTLAITKGPANRDDTDKAESDKAKEKPTRAVYSTFKFSDFEVTELDELGRKRKHMELAPEIKVLGLECNRKSPEGKGVLHLLDNPGSHAGTNEKSLLDSATDPSDVLPDLGPFENVLDLPDGGTIDGNTVVNELLSKLSWISAYENDKVQVKPDQGFEAMTGVEPSYVSDTEGMLAIEHVMNGSMQTTVNSLRSENESLKSYYSMSCAGYNNLFGDLTRSKELEVNLSKKVTSLEREKVGLRRPESDHDRGRDLGRQEARDLLMSNQRLLAFDPDLPRKAKDVVRGLKKTKWECTETVLSSPDLSPNLLRGVLERGDSSAGEGSSSRCVV
ncbi:hypothetical protein Tco_0664983 [Tanacetum coccineum]